MQKKTKVLSAAMLSLLAAGASAPVLLNQFLDEKEGNVIHAYPDSGGLWTICRGLTRIDGRPVTKGMTLSAQQCQTYNEIEVESMLEWTDENVALKGLNPAQRAGIASFCSYNLGATKCKKSAFWRKLNTGDMRGACSEIKRWVHDGGRDCRMTRGRKDGCYGQVIRRDQESLLTCWGLDDEDPK